MRNPTPRIGRAALAAGFMLAAWSVSSGPAQAAPQCDERTKVLRLLSDKYKEAPVAIGVTNNGGLVEVLSAGKGGTWSIIVTTPQGMSCLVAAGENWKTIEQLVQEPEA